MRWSSGAIAIEDNRGPLGCDSHQNRVLIRNTNNKPPINTQKQLRRRHHHYNNCAAAVAFFFVLFYSRNHESVATLTPQRVRTITPRIVHVQKRRLWWRKPFFGVRDCGIVDNSN